MGAYDNFFCDFSSICILCNSLNYLSTFTLYIPLVANFSFCNDKHKKNVIFLQLELVPIQTYENYLPNL